MWLKEYLLSMRNVCITVILLLGIANTITGQQSEHKDPTLTTGTLPNGLRYYIKTNASPSNRIELRLVVNAGSLLEDDDQRGFAHFLEHMAFNGTRNFPGPALIDFIEKAGMSFGADLNAYTNYDETVYKLTLPTDDSTIVHQGLQILEDWASGGITIDSNEVLAEPGVVLGEWRSRLADTAAENLRQHQDSVLYGNSPYRTRWPIGDPELLKTALPAPLRRFYQDWYRPDLIAVIIVGDVDRAQMEGEIKKRFGKIPAPENPRPRPSPAITTAKPRVDVVRAQTGPGTFVLWNVPSNQTTSEATFRHMLIEQLLFSELQDTYVKLRQQERRPFYSAHMGRSSLVRALGEFYVLNVVAQPDSMEHGLATAFTELERIAQHGIPQADLDRKKVALLRRLQSASDAQIADPSAAFADIYVRHYLTGDGVLLNEGQKLALAKHYLPEITSDVIAQTAKLWRDTTNLTILYRLPKFAHVHPPTRASLLALFDSIPRQHIAAKAESKTKSDASLLTTLPNKGRIIHERQFKTAGITEWTLSNGARVLYKPTSSNPDELLIYAHSMGGTSLLPDSLALSPSRLVGKMMTVAGGVGQSDRDQLVQQLNDKVLTEFEVALNYTDEAIRLGGSPRNLELMFQMMYLQFTKPNLDTAAVNTWKRIGGNGLAQSINDQIASVLSRHNPRLAPPSFATVDFVNLEQAMRIYQDRFGDAGDFTFTIVGAAAPEQVQLMVEQYIASLPSLHRPDRERPKDPNVRPLNSIGRSRFRILPVPRATTVLLFDGLFASDPKEYVLEQRRLLALTHVLNRRLRMVLREELGGTYGVSVLPRLYTNPKEHFQVMIQFDADPERADTLNRVLFENLDSVRTHGATPEELAVVTSLQHRRLERQLESNHYWMQMIQQYDRIGISFDKIFEPYTQALTADDIRVAAQQYIPDTAFIQMTYLPEKSEKENASTK